MGHHHSKVNPITPGGPVTINATGIFKDQCCLHAPKMKLIQTQKWDPLRGPDDKWTLRTLWDGQVGLNGPCDTNRPKDDITAILEDMKMDDLLNQMNLLWPEGQPAWGSEWNSQGTCVSTLRPKCFSNFTQNLDIAAFMQVQMELMRSRDTYKLLKDGDVLPLQHRAHRAIYKVERALDRGHGAKVILHCAGAPSSLVAVSYGWELEGCFGSGTFKPITPFGMEGGCPGNSHEFWYHPKDGSFANNPAMTQTRNVAPKPTHATTKIERRAVAFGTPEEK